MGQADNGDDGGDDDDGKANASYHLYLLDRRTGRATAEHVMDGGEMVITPSQMKVQRGRLILPTDQGTLVISAHGKQ